MPARRMIGKWFVDFRFQGERIRKKSPIDTKRGAEEYERHLREEMRAAARTGDRASLIRHDLEFHRQILDAAGNPALTQCWATLGVEAMLTLTIYRPLTDPAAVAESHVPIIEAMRSNRPAAAGRAARRHVELYARLARRTRSTH